MANHRFLVAVMLLLAACGTEEAGPSSAVTSPAMPETTITTTSQAAPASTTTGEEAPEATRCADVLGVEVTPAGQGVYTFDVTVSSPDIGWEKYADAWEIRDPEGNVLGVRELAHPHVDEQPFTRSLSGVEIPPDVPAVVVAARDSVEGFCGVEVTVDVG